MRNKKCLVIDMGIFTESAVRLARDCEKVWYYSAWEKAFVDDLSGKIGDGLDGVERVGNFYDYLDQADFILCPDVFSGRLVEFLKKHGYPVAGAGESEKLETDRWYGRTVQIENGLPNQKTIEIVGTTDLRKFCKEHENYFIKVDNGYRGISESFKHTDLRSTEPRLAYFDYKVGPYKDKAKFVCEEMIKGVEPGLDGITFDGDLLYPTMAGYEKKGCGYIARVYKKEEELPLSLRILHAGLMPEFKKNKTRFFYSVECIVTDDKIPYLLDQTMRLAAPGTSAVQTELIENYSEVIYGLATGEKVDPIMKYNYAAALSIESSEAAKTFVNISFPKEIRRWVKLRMACKVDSEYYSVPPFDSVGCVVALGDSVKEVTNLVLERVAEVKGTCFNSDTGGFKEIPNDIESGKKLGINF